MDYKKGDTVRFKADTFENNDERKVLNGTTTTVIDTKPSGKFSDDCLKTSADISWWFLTSRFEKVELSHIERWVSEENV
jgi:hypothetical protein